MPTASGGLDMAAALGARAALLHLRQGEEAGGGHRADEGIRRLSLGRNAGEKDRHCARLVRLAVAAERVRIADQEPDPSLFLLEDEAMDVPGIAPERLL